MKRVPTSDPHRHEFRGGATLLGLTVAAASVVKLLAILASREAQRSPASAYAIVATVALIGFLLISFRQGIVLDARERRYRRWWSVLVPVRVKKGSLDEFRRVALGNWKRQRAVYPVGLEGASTLALTEIRRYQTARQLAEDLARTLHLPLFDTSTGRMVVRDPEHLDESLRERRRRQGKPAAPLGEPPAGLRTRVEASGGTLRLYLPPLGFRGPSLGVMVLLGLLDVVLVLVFLVALLQGQGAVDRLLTLVVALAMVVPTALVFVKLFAAARTTQNVEATPRYLRVETRALFSSRAVEISSDAIEDLHVASAPAAGQRRGRSGPGGPIVARGDAESISFGEHLGRQEKEWLREVLEEVLSA